MLSIEEIVRALGPELLAKSGPCDIAFPRVVIDSRSTGRGDLFVALPGEHHNGHDFIGDAVRQGARGVIGHTLPLDLPQDVVAFRVGDSLAALQRLAAGWRAQHKLGVIGVTGSVGKTTAKELVAAVLSSRYRVLKSEGNLNTEIGIPLTLLGLTDEHQRAVLEMAMFAPGEISLLCQIARPSVGVVTNVGPVHLERLGSMEAIAAAKAELVQSLPSEGWAILNGDDPWVVAMAAKTRAQVLYYGTGRGCQLRGEGVTSRGLDGITFRLHYQDQQAMVSLPLPGRHNVYHALAAAAVGLLEGMGMEEIAGALARAQVLQRLRVLTGRGGCTILDDTYNASPASMLAALDLLAEMPGRRIALLGDMRELGEYAAQGHRRVGERAATAADILLTVGELGRLIAVAAREGDFVLLKASRALGLEAVAERLREAGPPSSGALPQAGARIRKG